MGYYILKVIVSALLIVIISEVSKHSSFIASLVASIPTVSFIAFIWLYFDTGDLQKVSNLSLGIFWLVIPSLALFLLLPLCIRQGLGFWLSLSISTTGTIGCYFLMVHLLKTFGIQI